MQSDQKARMERAAEFFREQAIEWPELMELCRPKEVVLLFRSGRLEGRTF